MYTHEYSDKHFDSYEACRDDFLENIDEDDIAQYLDLTVPDIISAFLRNKNNVDFSVKWMDIGTSFLYLDVFRLNLIFGKF